MSPLDATSPADLFGDDRRDLRSLKRSYARLIRAWPPETHPAEFQRIRALYEQAQAELESPAPAAPPPSDTAALLATLTPENLDEIIAQLTRRGLEEGDLGAFTAAIALIDARSPDQLLPVLADGLRVPAVSDRAVALTCAYVEIYPSLLGGPAWEATVAACRLGEDRGYLRRAELVALNREDPLRAWVRWEEVESDIALISLDAWRDTFASILDSCTHHLSSAHRERWRTRLYSATLQLSEDFLAWAERRLARGEAWVAARGQVDAAVLGTAAALLGGSGPECVARLASLPDIERFTTALNGLAGTNPGILQSVRVVVDSATQRQNTLWGWQTSGTKPSIPLSARAAAEIQRIARRLPPPPTPSNPDDEHLAATRRWKQQRDQWNQRKFLIYISVFVLLAVLGTAAAGPIGAGTAYVTLPFLMYYLENRPRPPAPARPAGDERIRVTSNVPDEDLLALCRSEGLWIHELAIATVTDPRLQAALSPLLHDPMSDLRVLSDAHIRRFFQPKSATP